MLRSLSSGARFRRRMAHQVTGAPSTRFAPLVAGFRLPRDHSVRFPDSAAFVASSFQAFVGDFRPELLECRCCRLVRVTFGIVSIHGMDQAPANNLAFSDRTRVDTAHHEASLAAEWLRTWARERRRFNAEPDDPARSYNARNNYLCWAISFRIDYVSFPISGPVNYGVKNIGG